MCKDEKSSTILSLMKIIYFQKIYASGGSVICTEEDIIQESSLINDMGFQGYKIRVGLKSWNEYRKELWLLIVI